MSEHPHSDSQPCDLDDMSDDEGETVEEIDDGKGGKTIIRRKVVRKVVKMSEYPHSDSQPCDLDDMSDDGGETVEEIDDGKGGKTIIRRKVVRKSFIDSEGLSKCYPQSFVTKGVRDSRGGIQEMENFRLKGVAPRQKLGDVSDISSSDPDSPRPEEYESIAYIKHSSSDKKSVFDKSDLFSKYMKKSSKSDSADSMEIDSLPSARKTVLGSSRNSTGVGSSIVEKLSTSLQMKQEDDSFRCDAGESIFVKDFSDMIDTCETELLSHMRNSRTRNRSIDERYLVEQFDRPVGLSRTSVPSSLSRHRASMFAGWPLKELDELDDKSKEESTLLSSRFSSTRGEEDSDSILSESEARKLSLCSVCSDDPCLNDDDSLEGSEIYKESSKNLAALSHADISCSKDLSCSDCDTQNNIKSVIPSRPEESGDFSELSSFREAEGSILSRNLDDKSSFIEKCSTMSGDSAFVSGCFETDDMDKMQAVPHDSSQQIDSDSEISQLESKILNTGESSICASRSGDNDESDVDPVKIWGKPLNLPLPPVKSNGNRKRVDSPSSHTKKSKASGQSPVYVDLAYVPHHAHPYYVTKEYFNKVRAKYYVFSGIEPSKEVFNALLEAKQEWEDKDAEVTIIPTYDTDSLCYWVAENEDLLAANNIDLAPSASRCTINLQDHDTSCSAYRLEF